jgi:hypothetical protein
MHQLDSAIYLSDNERYAEANERFLYVMRNLRSIPSDLTYYFGKNSYHLKKYRQSVDWLNKYIQLKGTSGQYSSEAVEWLKKAEAELFASHSLLKTIIDIAPVQIFWKDSESRYLGANKAFALDSNLKSPNDLVGKSADGIKLAPFTVDESTWGFRIGAPIIKNKLFIFGNYEAFKSSVPALSFFPTGSESTSNLSRTTLADMQDVASFTLSKLGWDAGELYGFNNQTNSKKALVRLDYNINDNHKLAVRYSQHDSDAEILISGSNSSNTAGFGNRTNSLTSLSPQNTGYIIEDNTRSLAAELNSNFGGKFSNKFIATYNYQTEDRRYRTSLFPTVEIQSGGSTYTSLGFDPFTPSY